MRLHLGAKDFGLLCFGEKIIVNVSRHTTQYKALKKAFENGTELNIEVCKSGGTGGSVALLPCYVDRPTESAGAGFLESFTIKTVDNELS